MQYMADANYRQSVNLRMRGRSPPYYPDRLTDRSVPNVNEILRHGESIPGRYGDVRRAANCPPPPVPPPAPQNAGWHSSPRRTLLPMDPHFDALRNELPRDAQNGDFAFNLMHPESRDDYDSSFATRRNGSPIATRRNRSPIATRRNGSPIIARRSESPFGDRRNGSPIGARRNGPPADLATYMNIFSENLPGGRAANISPTDPQRNDPARSGSPTGPVRSGSPTGAQHDYATAFSQNLPGGPAMFNDMEALPMVRSMDSINPTDPHFHTQKSNQGRHPTHLNVERWSNNDKCSSENYNGNRGVENFDPNRSFQNYDGNRSFQNFDGNRSFQNFDANRSFQNYDTNRSYQNFDANRSFQNYDTNRSYQNFDANRTINNLDANRSIHNYDANRSFHNFDESFQSNDGNRSYSYFNDYQRGNDSGFVNDRPSYEVERRNFGNFGRSNDTNYSRIDQGYNHQGINSLLHLNTSYVPEVERKRKAREIDDCLAEKRACPERIEKIFRVCGFRMEYATLNPDLELPQPEAKSYAVRFFKKYPVYRIGSKKSETSPTVECNIIENEDMVDSDAVIRSTIAEEWKKAYREKNYRLWGNWWKDFRDCGADIRKELARFEGFDVKKNFEPPEGPIDSEEYVSLAMAALKENNITYLKNMRDIYRLVEFNVLQNLTADASAYLQDIIRSIPNHLWRYKMRSLIFTWSWYQKMANCENPDDQQCPNIMPLWNNPILHWLAKQAFDEMVIISKYEFKNFKDAFPDGLFKPSSDPDQKEAA